MALKAVITSDADYEALPDSLKTEYKKEGKIYLLDVTSTEVTVDDKLRIYGLENIHGLKSALSGERTTVADLKKQAKAFEKIKDPAVALAAIEKLEAMSQEPGVDEKAKDIAKDRIAQIEKKFGTELQESRDANKALESEFSEVLIRQRAQSAMGKHKMVEGGADLLMHVIENATRVVVEDGKRHARAIGENGEGYRISLRDGDTGPMGIDELVDVMSKDKRYGALFQGTEATGSAGTTPKVTPKETPKETPANPKDAGIQAHLAHSSPTADLQAAYAAQAAAKA